MVFIFLPLKYFFDIEIDILDLIDNGVVDNTQIYKVPKNHFFVMGDNRDNSQDSRFLNNVGYIPINNLIGKGQYIFFWKWPKAIRFERLIKKIK